MASDANILYQIEARLIEVFGIAKSSGDGFLTHLISVALLDAQEKLGSCGQDVTKLNAQIYDFTVERISRRRPETVGVDAIQAGVDAAPTI